MAAFHVYVEGPVDRSVEGIQRLAVAISAKYGLPVPDLVKRMTAGRFRVKANIDAATADAYARALEEVGARVKVEEARPTVPTGSPIVEAAPPPAPAPKPPAEAPRTKAPTLPGEKPSLSGVYSVSTPSSSRTAVPGSSAKTTVPPPARAKAPTSAPSASSPSTPPREGHPSSQLMPVRPNTPSSPPPTPALPPASRSNSPSTPPPITSSSSSQSTSWSNDRGSTVPPATARPTSSASWDNDPAPAPPPARSGSSSLPPATARAGSSSLPPKNERSGSTSIPPQNAKNAPFQSGLSAAYSQEIPVAADLGALGDLSLASLDGNEGAQDPAGSFAPPEPAPAAKFKAPTAKPAPPPEKPKDAPLDLFRPPDAEEAEQIVNLAVEDERPKKSTAAPPTRANTPTTPSTPQLAPVPVRKQPRSHGAAMGGVSAPEMPRGRFVAGVLLSIILGFIPAHLVAASREASAFQKIDAQIVATQDAADTPETYAALDSFRETQIARKESEKRSIALTSFLIWAVVAAGLGYVYFRRIPWDRTPR